MARFKEEEVRSALLKHLEPGEELLHWTYGVKQPSMLLMLPLFILAILPGAIAVALLTKEYIVGLTNRRLIVLRVKGRIKVLEVTDYPLSGLPEFRTTTGPIFTHLRINDAEKPFVAKFHRAGMKDNRLHSTAIEAALKAASDEQTRPEKAAAGAPR